MLVPKRVMCSARRIVDHVQTPANDTMAPAACVHDPSHTLTRVRTQLLLRQVPGVNMSVRQLDHSTPLYLAASRGHANVVRLLVKALLAVGASVNARGAHRSTPLHAGGWRFSRFMSHKAWVVRQPGR